MKKNITRIYDKNKTGSRKKYMLIIMLILVLQVAIYFSAFSKAETVIPIEYINYYTRETYDGSIQVKNDIKGKYIILPEEINNRKVITYYIEETVEEIVKTTELDNNLNNTITNTLVDTIKETKRTKEYKPNDTYYIENTEKLSVKVEYGEYISLNIEAEENVLENAENNIIGNNTTENDSNTDIIEESEEIKEYKIRDTVYLGDIRTRRRRRNKVKSI